jgi:hypothetical protein
MTLKNFLKKEGEMALFLVCFVKQLTKPLAKSVFVTKPETCSTWGVRLLRPASLPSRATNKSKQVS